MEELDAKFLLGICLLAGWAIVMCMCAAPQVSANSLMHNKKNFSAKIGGFWILLLLALLNL
jgi:hypothetical protein